ncbi:Ankyrin-1 [Durusdinium trenchii]|uniref:Ankyrin-1 n=1 Tax=Durusdinium trenchii TaxID=1381693 RepID=A0ABP0S073_9DINO
MKFTAFLIATTLSGAVRLQQTSEESSSLNWSPHADDAVTPSSFEDLQIEANGCKKTEKRSLFSKMRGWFRSEEDQLKEVPWSLGDDVNGESIQEELVKFLDKDRPETSHRKEEKFPIFEKPDMKSVAFLESAMKSETKEPCQQQLGGLMRELQKACEQERPYEHRRFFEPLPPKTCSESVKDLFLHGQDLVDTSQVPDTLVRHAGVPPETLPLAQSLWFLQDWLVKLATAEKEAILWAGFWTDPEAEDGHLHRASKETLQRFAHLTETETVHPSTKLGRIIAGHNELDQCKGELAWKLTGNFWSFASYSFVRGMKIKKQGTVIALVNKDLKGPRPLNNSVLFQHEVPTLGVAAWGLGFWSPQVILIDLKATCNKTSSMLRERLFARLSPYFRVKAQEQYFTSAEYALRSKPSWQCLDCEEGKCELGPELATHLQVLRQARHQEDKLNQQLLELVTRFNLAHAEHGGEPANSVRQLLELNADPSRAFRKDGMTPLHLAAGACLADTVRQLLRCGAPTDAKAGPGGFTPLMKVANARWYCDRPEGADIAQQLLLHGAKAKARAWLGRTALDPARPNAAVAEVLKKHLAG